VELAREQLGRLENKSVVVVGAGEMSELTTRYLMQVRGGVISCTAASHYVLVPEISGKSFKVHATGRENRL